MTRLCLNCDLPPSAHTTLRRGCQICEECRASLARKGLSWCTRGRHQVVELAAGKSWCRACERARQPARSRADYAKAWRAANPDKVRAYQEKHRARRAEAARARYHANRAAALAKSRAQYERHREKKIAYARAWRERNRDLSRAQARARYARRKLRALWGGTR